MKTLMTANGSVIRRKDEEAARLVDGTGDYEYCSKSEWKKIRPTPKGQGKNKLKLETKIEMEGLVKDAPVE